MTTAHIVVVSDKAIADPDENRAGPVLTEALDAAGITVATSIVPSGAEAVREALAAAVSVADIVVTTGGTGIRPGDCVVDETLALGLVELPGIAEEIRRRGAATTPVSLLSRAVAGLVERDGRRVFVLNAPSSRGGARAVAAVLGDVLTSLVRDLNGDTRL